MAGGGLEDRPEQEKLEAVWIVVAALGAEAIEARQKIRGRRQFRRRRPFRIGEMAW